MGLLIDGVWHSREEQPFKPGGGVERPQTAFRNWVTPDGRPGPTGHDGFAAAKGRYHLYVSLACPWAHRTLIMRALKRLEEIVPVSVTHWLMADQGWTFTPAEGVIPDPLFNSRYLHESTLGRTPTILAAPAFRRHGIDIPRRSSTMSQPKSSACSTAPLILSAPSQATSIRSHCEKRSRRSTAGFTKRSTMASIKPDLRLRSRHMRKRSRHCSRLWTGWRSDFPDPAFFATMPLPRPIFDCSRHWCGSIPSMSDISNVMSGDWPIIGICGLIRETSTSGLGYSPYGQHVPY